MVPKSPPEAIAAVVRDAAGRYLLIRRGPEVPAPGYWTPLTGRLEHGETLADALVRECLEEVGLAVRAGEEIYRCPTADGRWTLVWITAEIIAPAGTPALVLHAREVAEAGWYTADEACGLEPMFPATRAFFEARRRGR